MTGVQTCALPISGLQVMAIAGSTKEQIYFIGSTNAVDRDLYKIAANGTLVQLTHGGVNGSSAPVSTDSGTLMVVASSHLIEMKREFTVLKDGKPVHVFDNLAEHPVIHPEVHIFFP